MTWSAPFDTAVYPALWCICAYLRSQRIRGRFVSAFWVGIVASCRRDYRSGHLIHLSLHAPLAMQSTEFRLSLGHDHVCVATSSLAEVERSFRWAIVIALGIDAINKQKFTG